MKTLSRVLMLLLVLTPRILSAQTKLKVAYPTTVGSMAVIWVTKDAKLFEKYGLDVELIYVAGSSRIVQSMLAKDIPISEIAIPAVIQANLAGADLVMLADFGHGMMQQEVRSLIQERAPFLARLHQRDHRLPKPCSPHQDSREDPAPNVRPEGKSDCEEPAGDCRLPATGGRRSVQDRFFARSVTEQADFPAPRQNAAQLTPRY